MVSGNIIVFGDLAIDTGFVVKLAGALALILSAVSSRQSLMMLPSTANCTAYTILPVSQALARAGHPFKCLTF
jgi:hypothetical protein